MKKITILHVIETIGVGGAEKALVQTVNGIPEYNHIIATLFEPDGLKEKLKEAKLIKLNATSLWGKLKAVRKLRKIIKEESVDIVHAQLFHSTIVGRLAAHNKLPFVFTIQSMLGEDLFNKDFISRTIEKLTYSKRNYLIAVSQSALDDYKKHISINSERSQIIYNSIEEVFFSEHYKDIKSAKRLRLVAIGNLKPVKNYNYILDAIKNLPVGVAELDIYGIGVSRNMLERRIKEEAIPAVLKGNVSDLNIRLRNYDIYLHCSKYEGSSLAVFEAMASGLPVIASDIPVLRENTGENALFVNLMNPDDLTQKIVSIQKGELNVNIKGRKGFEWVKTVAHPSIIIKETVDFYKKILKENSKN